MSRSENFVKVRGRRKCGSRIGTKVTLNERIPTKLSTTFIAMIYADARNLGIFVLGAVKLRNIETQPQ